MVRFLLELLLTKMSLVSQIWIYDEHLIKRSYSTANGTNEIEDSTPTDPSSEQSTDQSINRLVFLALFCVVGVAGIILNTTMIVIYMRRKFKMLNRMVSNRFNLNLVVVNLLQVTVLIHLHTYSYGIQQEVGVKSVAPPLAAPPDSTTKAYGVAVFSS